MNRKMQLPKAYTRAPLTLDEENRTVSVVLSSGHKGLRRSLFGEFYESLSLEPGAVDLSRLQGGPLLADHKNSVDSVIGTVRQAFVQDGELRGEVEFAKNDNAQKVFDLVRAGHVKSLSIGYVVNRYEAMDDSGETPHYRAVDWSVLEASAVAVPFDPQATFRTEESQKLYPVEILTRAAKSDDATGDTMTKEEQLAHLRAQESQRCKAIRQAVKDAGLDSKLADEYIECGTSVSDADENIKMFARYAKEQTEHSIHSEVRVQTGTDEVDKKREAAIESLLFRINPTIFKPTKSNPLIGFNLMRTLEAVVPRRSGMSDSQYATRVMSSSDLPYILANVAEKTVQKKYEIAVASSRAWVRKDTLKNFKTHDRVRSGDFASLEERLEGGEFKRGTFGEEREQVTLKEYGKMMAFSRRMLINDDLGEIVKVMDQAGSAAAALENQLVYEQLTSNPDMGDGNPLFDNAHGNLSSGAAISDTTIGDAFLKLRQMKTVDNLHYLNLAPSFLISGPSSEVLALKYLAQISPTQASSVNVFSKALSLVIDPLISSDDYFFAASPGSIDTVVLYTLEGEEAPRVETRTDFETESLEIKCAHSVVAKAMDWRGLVKNPGPT